MDGPRKIDVLYAYIVLNDEGAETVPIVLVPEWDGIAGQVMVPLIGADQGKINALRRVIFSTPALQGKTLQLVKFEQRQLVDIMKPDEHL